MIEFYDSENGAVVNPDDYDGEYPHVGDILRSGDDLFAVLGVTDRSDCRVVTLKRTSNSALFGIDPFDHPGETKDTNPKDAVGIGKAPLSTVPAPFLHALGLAMMEGARKYGRHNYRTAGIRYSVYYDAAMRHLTAWWEGEDIDPDSGLPHPIKAAACMAVLFDSMVQENATDDRPPQSPPGWLAGMNKHAADLLKKYPESLPPHTEL